MNNDYKLIITFIFTTLIRAFVNNHTLFLVLNIVRTISNSNTPKFHNDYAIRKFYIFYLKTLHTNYNNKIETNCYFLY